MKGRHLILNVDTYGGTTLCGRSFSYIFRLKRGKLDILPVWCTGGTVATITRHLEQTTCVPCRLRIAKNREDK